MGLSQVKARKGLGRKEDLYDRAGSAELAANEFRITQTEESLTRNKIIGELPATREHRRIGERVRQTIKDLGNTMPENLPPAPSIKKLELEKRKALKNK
jgi:DNA-damage-inducible protein D